MDERIERFVDDITAGLKDDPELRLDVRAELINHLEETAETAEGGVDGALQVFGPSAGMSEALVAGNLRRMHLRARVRLALRAVLLPAAIVIALIVGYGGLVRCWDLTNEILYHSGYLAEYRYHGFFTLLPRLPFTRTPKQRVMSLVEGKLLIRPIAPYSDYNDDPYYIAYTKHLYKLWQAHRDDPEGKIYYACYANYASYLQGVELGEQVLRQGTRVDPDNALYHYLLAERYFSYALEIKRKSRPRGGDPRAQPQERSYSEKYEWTVRDRQWLDRGLREWRIACAKPSLRTYHLEHANLRLAQLPAPRSSEDYLDRWYVGEVGFYPDAPRIRKLADALPACAQILFTEGRETEAREVLESWKILLRHRVHDEVGNLGQTRIISSGARFAAQNAADIYEENGYVEDARRTRAELARIIDPVNARLDRRDSAVGIRRHAGIFSRHVVTGFSADLASAEELAPMRYVEHALVEQAAVSLALVLLCAVMLYYLAVSLRDRMMKGSTEEPLLLLPSWRDAARITGFGILLPLIVYSIYTMLPFSGRENGFGFADTASLLRIPAECLFVLLCLLILPGRLAISAIRRRCRSLRLPVPPPGSSFDVLIFSTLLAGALIIGILLTFFLVIETSGLLGGWHFYTGKTASVPIFIFSCIFISWIFVLHVFLRRRFAERARYRRACREDDYRRYFGTVVRSLVPVYVGAVILVAVIAYPAAVAKERYWLHADRIVFPRESRINAIETQQANELSEMMLRAVIEVEQSSPAGQK